LRLHRQRIALTLAHSCFRGLISELNTNLFDFKFSFCLQQQGWLAQRKRSPTTCPSLLPNVPLASEPRLPRDKPRPRSQRKVATMTAAMIALTKAALRLIQRLSCTSGKLPVYLVRDALTGCQLERSNKESKASCTYRGRQGHQAKLVSAMWPE
jgi:hypothetical protein